MNLRETKTKNINNQRIFKEIDDFMMDVFGTLDVYWTNSEHRDQLAEMLDMWLEQYALESGNIIQYNMFFKTLSDDEFAFVLRYRQKNCYNTSEIKYIFEEDLP